MAKKSYLITVFDEDKPFDAIIMFAMVVTLIGAAIYAAVLIIPVLIGLFIAWRVYKAWRYSPGNQAKRELAEIRELHNTVQYMAGRVEIPDPQRLLATVLVDIEEYFDGEKSVPDFMVPALFEGTSEVLRLSGLGKPPAFDERALAADVDARNKFRNEMQELHAVYQRGDTGIDDVYSYLCDTIGEIVSRLPSGDAFSVEPNDYDFTVQILDVLSDKKGLAEAILFLPFSEVETPTLKALQDRSLARMAAVSGKRVDDLLDNPQKIPHPKDDKRNGTEVLFSYLGNWPFIDVLKERVAYRIPSEVRFEHMHVLGGTGHGKTQLLQRFIREDLTKIYLAHRHREAGSFEMPPLRSMVVMDGQGDLIRNVARRDFCSPDDVLRDRVILIDPTDIEYPLALNMFDLNEDELKRLSPADREMVYNGTIELYVYLFGALLDAEMTQKQDVLFRYIARLMLVIPNATLETLRDVMEDGEAYQPYIDKLDASAQAFFRTQFFGNEFKDTKQQLLRRLWGILSNSALANMFNSPVNKIDLFEELQKGSVILINTAKDYLKTDGSRVFGRFWVAMLAQAALRRAALYPGERVDTHVYIDEAHEVIDDKVEEILNQARKYRIGLTLAHQNRQQLSPAARATLASSTAIKMVGGVSEDDARGYAGELRTDAATILNAKKRSGGTEFVTYVRNHTDTALTLNVGFGTLERMDQMDPSQFEALKDNVRKRYCRSEKDSPESKAMASKSEPKPESGFELGVHEDL